jgi:hypothetical protein
MNVSHIFCEYPVDNLDFLTYKWPVLHFFSKTPNL